MTLKEIPIATPRRIGAAVATFIALVLIPFLIAPPIARLLERDLESVVSRCLMIAAVASILVLAGPELWGGIRRWLRERKGDAFLSFGISWSVTLIACVTYVSILLAIGWMQKRPDDPGPFIGKLFQYAGAGVCIGLIEEWVFRGLLWRQFGARIGILAGAIATSALYAWVHIEPPKTEFLDPTAADVLAVYLAIGEQLFAPFAAPTVALWAKFFGLFLFGILLTVLVYRSGRLAPAIGCHAAVVFFIKGDGKMIRQLHKGRDYHWLLGTRDYQEGLLVWAVLAVMIVLAWVWGRRLQRARVGT